MVTDDSREAALVLPQTPALKTLSVADGKSSTRPDTKGRTPRPSAESENPMRLQEGVASEIALGHFHNYQGERQGRYYDSHFPQE